MEYKGKTYFIHKAEYSYSNGTNSQAGQLDGEECDKLWMKNDEAELMTVEIMSSKQKPKCSCNSVY